MDEEKLRVKLSRQIVTVVSMSCGIDILIIVDRKRVIIGVIDVEFVAEYD